MTKSGPRVRRRFTISYGWVILLCAVIGFGLVTWTRLRLEPGPTALEKLIAQNAPAENVLNAAVQPDGSILVATTLGAVRGTQNQWSRIAGLQAEVSAIVPAEGGAFFVAVKGTGIARYEGGALRTLLAGDATSLTAVGTEPGHLLAVMGGRTLQESRDGGSKWTALTEFAAEPVLAVAADPGQSGRLVAGGLQGSVFLSGDGGRTWDAQPAPGGTITALAFDPGRPGRLWACAGGKAVYSDAGSGTWVTASWKPGDRQLVGLAPAPGGGAGVVAVSADGLLVRIGTN